jgi:ATP-dependent Lhr-like helicase
MNGLSSFHPVVRAWFERRFPDGPTDPQRHGWPCIARGSHTLIAAPTGSGKTLAAFLVCIDRLLREGEAKGTLEDRTDVIYVSPLRALTVDVQHNLQTPLAEIRTLAAELGHALPEVRVLVRSGDTPAWQRTAMTRRPPHVLVTTPESLYLLLTAEKSRQRLHGVRTVIVDEIHALAADRRGAHLALSLERLEELCSGPPVRIGLSATQRPVETIARWLVGAGAARSDASGRPLCEVVDLGHRRALDLAIELPEDELGAVATHEQFGDLLDRIAAHVRAHRTTLIFVNTRRLAERVAHLLGERLGPDQVAAHHGSLAKERRERVEARLRSGQLRALVATASLELGIDIGPVELVCLIGSPRRFATLLQRVGRSGHAREATPKGRLLPTTRDELVECAALLRGVQAGRLETTQLPRAPVDVLAQQIVAACAAEPWREEDLYPLVRRATPYAELGRPDFDAVVEMLSEGIRTGRGRRAAYLHRDRVNGVLRGRRGARLVALTSGGAIPETFDYRVIAEPDDTLVGTVNEDFAIESQSGDVFLLGSTSWRVRRVEAGTLRVVDAHGAPPSVPFWLGEAPARSGELSEEVSRLRAEVGQRLAGEGSRAAATWLAQEAGLEACAEAIVRYLEAARAALGILPTQRDVVYERFFDEAGGMQLVIHAPFGGRVNRALGLALRKRFCRRFDFELQAAASDDAVLLSLGPQHSFPLSDVPRFLSSRTVRGVLAQALLPSPFFTARWRWNAGRALAVPRWRGSRRVPPPIQRMEADDLLAAVFPALAACQENVTGPIEIPEDHPLVHQTLDDALHEATDVAELERCLQRLETGAIRIHLCETTEPSPLAHEILNGRPYTFLDDAPLEERRSRAVALRRGIPESLRELARLDPEAIERVREEVRPTPRDPEELHDLLFGCVLLRPDPCFVELFDVLRARGRATALRVEGETLWVAAERLSAARKLLPRAQANPPLALPMALRRSPPLATVAEEALRGHLECAGPTTRDELVARTRLEAAAVEAALAQLEAEGFVLRGRFDAALPDDVDQFCARRLLSRIHLYTQERLRREIEPVSAQDFLRFLLRWQHVAPGTQREGQRGLLAVLERLQGFQLAAGAWEGAVLAKRVDGYRSQWLDALCLAGEVVWGRLALPEDANDPTVPAPRGGAFPSRTTPIGFALREDLGWLLAAARGEASPTEPGEGATRDLLETLRAQGALFSRELVEATRRLPVEVEHGLWDLVVRGWVTADGFATVRSLLGERKRFGSRRAGARQRRLRVRELAAGGRFALLPRRDALEDRDMLAERVAAQLLARWGVVLRELLARETLAVPWREIARALRRMEARGTVRGGRFVSGFVGEQFALPGAVEALRRTRRRPRQGEIVSLAAVDPLNLVGILTPGPRIPALRSNSVVYRDGLPIRPQEVPASHARGAS